MNGAATCEADRFLALLRPIEGDLERYCRRLIWEQQEAADALQNAVMRGFAAFDRYRPDASFRAWMFKILTREAFAMNRKHARVARHEYQLEPEELAGLPVSGDCGQEGPASPTLDELDETLEPALSMGLRTLSETERAVLLLRAMGDLRYREISEGLGIPLGSVMGNLSRARQKMRAVLARSAGRSRSMNEDRV
jgi:RNA polymerase sigma-70 factor (ECF subfamily)